MSECVAPTIKYLPQDWQVFAPNSFKINFVLNNTNTQEITEMKERNKEYGLKNSWRDVSNRMYNFYTLTNLGKLNEYVG